MRRAIDSLRRLPRAAVVCALVGFLNAVIWMVVTPPFQVPDETGHVVYAQHLAETGQIPDDDDAYPFSDELQATVVAQRFGELIGRPDERSVPAEYYDSAVDSVVADPPNPANGRGSIESSNQPPLYYAAAAAAYLASPWQDLLHRLWLMRLVSALFAGLTTLFTYLFLREVLAEPWTWTVGALAVAFQPLFGFISSGVHPDALLFTASAALFFTVARAFRRGLTPGRGAAIGLALTVGLFTKLNFVALIPGVVIALGLLVWRAGAKRPGALRGAATALGVLAAAVVLFGALNAVVWDRPLNGRVTTSEEQVAPSEPASEPAAPITRKEQLSYTWQLYLPRLPFMQDQFAYYPLWQTFFKGTIGVFGWLDTTFDTWVYTLALILVIPLVALLLAALWRRRASIRARWAELLDVRAHRRGAAGLGRPARDLL